MKKMWTIYVFIILFICAGCANSVKSDLAEYAKFDYGISQELEAYQNDFSAMEKNVNNMREEAQLLSKMNYKLIAIAEKQKNYKPQTKKVQQIHKKAVKATDETLEIVNDYIEAVESNSMNKAKYEAMQDRLKDIRKLSNEYHNDIIVLQKN